MTKQLRGWDSYVQESQRDPLEIPAPDGTPFTLNYPSKSTIDLLNTAEGHKGSDDDFAIALLGEAEGCRLLTLAADAPAGTIQLMLGDAMVEWKLWKRNPFREEPEDAKEEEEKGNSARSST